MDISKIPFYNGAIAAIVLAATAPTDAKSNELAAMAEQDKNNLITLIEKQILQEADRLLKVDKKEFDEWFFTNIKNQKDYK